MEEQKIRLGVSACLLGQKVRYDGGHKLDRFIAGTLADFAEFVPVCPEAECGLGVPREPMHLVGDPPAPRLVTVRTGVDHTARMTAWARRRAVALEAEGLWGFIFKSKSPSCGIRGVPVSGADGARPGRGAGLFARIFMQHFPLLPAVDERRLHDMRLRENFIERVFTLKRWRDTLAAGRTRGNLVAFHTRHKLLLLAHSPKHCRQMGRLVGRARELETAELFAGYEALLLEAMRLKATPAKHANALRRAVARLGSRLSPDERQELLDAIADYRGGRVPLIVPVTLVNHHVRKYGHPFLNDQWHLNPHPLELRLRNHA